MPVQSPIINPTAFVLCPVEIVAAAAAEPVDWGRVRDVYRQAYEQARAVVRPSVLERLAPVWN